MARVMDRLEKLLERATETLERIDRRMDRRERKPKEPPPHFDQDRHLASVRKALAGLQPHPPRRRT
jgi:hypothetical protein